MLPSIKSVADDLAGYVPDEERNIELTVVVTKVFPGFAAQRQARIEKLLGISADAVNPIGDDLLDLTFHIGYGEVAKMEAKLKGKSALQSIIVSWNVNEDQMDEAGENYGLDVRLQVENDGNWSLHTGDAQYDTDHRGFWGAGTLVPDMTKAAIRELARELIDEAASSMS